MSIRDQIKAQSITALKARDKATRSALSGVLALFTEQEKSGKFDGWTEAAEQSLVASYVKKLKSALGEMRDGDVKDSYVFEIGLLEPYLPTLLNRDETRNLIEPMVADAKGLGHLMGMVMREHKGKVDGKLVRELAMELGLK
ncbi:MAG: GatB/YqeY domain-containing protein [Proteobacteria bacterium]|nr:GatB/YqeY domain-containing protein [Pseudomonadota bacterium]